MHILIGLCCDVAVAVAVVVAMALLYRVQWWYLLSTFFFLLFATVLSVAARSNPFCHNRCRDTLSPQPSVLSAASAPAAASCVQGCSSSPAFATRCDAVLNVVVAVCGVLTWIGCVVVLGGELMRATFNVSPVYTTTIQRYYTLLYSRLSLSPHA